MRIDKAVVVNWALTEIGHFAVYSTAADDDLAVSVNNCWQRCVDRCLSLSDWHDFRRTYKLTRSAETPENGWQFEHALPGARVGEPLKILERAGECPEPLRNFDREGNFVYANCENIWARCKVYLDPEYWDPGWRAAFTEALAGYLAPAILHDHDMMAEKHKIAFGTPSKEGGGGMFGRLMGQNHAGAPVGSSIANADPLTLAHRGRLGGPWHGRY